MELQTYRVKSTGKQRRCWEEDLEACTRCLICEDKKKKRRRI
jgi:hypothetical protein